MSTEVANLPQIRSLPRPVWVLLGASGVNSLGTGLVYPLLIVYLTRVQEFSVSVATGAVSLTSLGAFVCGPVAGWASDRFGRTRTVFGAMLVSAAGMVVYAVATTVWQTMLAALIVGLGIGANSVWYALLAEAVTEKDRPTVFALNFTMMNLAVGVGGLIASLATAGGQPWVFHLLFLTNAASFVVVGVVVLRGYRQSPAPAPAPGEEPGTTASVSYRALLADRRILAIFGVTCLFYMAGYSQLESGFSAVLVETRGMGPRELAILFAVNTTVVVVAQLFLLPVFRSFPPKRALGVVAVSWASCWGLILLVVAMSDFTTAVLVSCVAIAVFAVGECFFSVAMPTVVNAVATDGNRGRINGIYGAATSAGFVLGPLLAGGLLDQNMPNTFILGALVTCLLTWLLSFCFLPALGPSARKRVTDQRKVPC
ncbi:MFS transporter [Streptomyces sp. NBC_01716]|uniref:MFS transporter n=1 Tax=Streptomyces sp. NBC_01716 TaxID=2975917 RepID=UPI002E2F61BE|nr:MFS transporter [Streptomyces sp. NBC_01716]